MGRHEPQRVALDRSGDDAVQVVDRSGPAGGLGAGSLQRCGKIVGLEVVIRSGVPVKRLPPSFGITFSTTPLLAYSAEVLPEGESTTTSWAVSAFT
jgi:hypothetical protein